MLLGLAKLIEIRGESWTATDEEVDRFLSQVYRSDK
jgi:hypothetical protein